MTTQTNPTTAFQQLDPTHLLDAMDAAGWQTDGRVTALNSYENRVYQVGLEDGTSVVAKFYRPERWTDAAILEEHAFTQELHDCDIPVISPIAGQQGSTLHRTEAFRFTVFEKAGGRPPELDDPDQLEVIGRTLGRLHLVGQQAAFSERVTLDPVRLGDESLNFLLSSELLPMESQSVYEGVASDIMQQVHAAFSATTVSHLRIHGDFHPGNILWGRDDTPHVLDFDDTCAGPAVQDLWMFISGDRPYRTARLADVLEGYTQFREFDPRELALIEPLRSLRLLHYAAWIARRWDDPAFKMAFPFFAERRFWDEHILSLREQRAMLDEPALIWD